MRKPVWYSITAKEAVSMIKEGLSLKVELEKETLVGKIGSVVELSVRHFCLLRVAESPDHSVDHIYCVDVAEVIFKTDDSKLEIIEPGKRVFTITL